MTCISDTTTQHSANFVYQFSACCWILSVVLCIVAYAAANLLQRVGTVRPQTAPGTPLSFASPAHDLTPRRMPFAVPGADVFGSASETARPADADLTRRLQMIASVDESATRRKERPARGML